MGDVKDARTFLGELRSFEDSTLTLRGGEPLRVGVASWNTFQKSEAVQLGEAVGQVSAIPEAHAVYLSAVPARRSKLGLVAKGFVEEKPIAVLYAYEKDFLERFW